MWSREKYRTTAIAFRERDLATKLKAEIVSVVVCPSGIIFRMLRPHFRALTVLVSCLFGLTVCACVSSREPAKSDEQIAQEVRAVMETQAAAWNRGDIEGFME